MICVMTANQTLREDLVVLLQAIRVPCEIVDPAVDGAIANLYASGVKAVVVDDRVNGLVKDAWLDMLGSLGRRIPVFILGSSDLKDLSVASRNSELLTWNAQSDAREILALLQASGAVARTNDSMASRDVPQYNPQVALHMLQGNGALSMLLINGRSLRSIAIEFGVEAYQKMQICLQSALFELWGKKGSFRSSDLIMRRSMHSNTYYVFLEQSRVSRTLPAPGVLEKLADRIALRLQESLWNQILKGKNDRAIPDCIKIAPEICIGHASAIYNPCVDSVEVLDHLIETSSEISKVQQRRIRDRQREVLQSVIQSREILFPNYQAVFNLRQVDKTQVDESFKRKSIVPLKNAIYGFESLIRARKDVVDEKIAGDHLVYMDFRLFRPDILFALAANCKVALELDQICMGLGVAQGVNLPGVLMVNILPRNLLHIERLSHLISTRGKIVFELSESEGISNPELMNKMREFVTKIDCAVAADDFGKGHASIERVIGLRPELIKLDRSLIDKIHKDPVKRMFVEGIIKASKLVNSKVLAEGVELWEEAEMLKDMGVDYVQGFLLHRPQPLEDILQQLEDDASLPLVNVA